MAAYFTFKGETSVSKDILLRQYPTRILPATRVQEVIIPGRDGSLTISENAYESIVLECECTTKASANIEAISAWLKGPGDLVFSDKSTQLFKARVDAQISFEKIMRGRAQTSFTIPFVCQPGRYINPPADNVRFESPDFITNPGNMPSEPLINVAATGEITLTIGDTILAIEGPNSLWRILIDSEMMDCFNGGKTVLRNHWVTGDFPLLKPGPNAVSWDGDVDEVIITPRWRNL